MAMGTCKACKKEITRLGKGPLSTKKVSQGVYVCASCRTSVEQERKKAGE